MTNNQFMIQWQQLLAHINTHFKNKSLENPIITLPFLDLSIDIITFLRIWEQLYPLFMNINANSVDIVFDQSKEITKCVLHHAFQEKYFNEYIEISLDQLPMKNLEVKDLKNFFEEWRFWCKKKYNMDLGNLRIYSDQFLQDLKELKQQNENTSKNNDLIWLIGMTLDRILQARKEGELYFYPDPPFCQMMDQVFSHLILISPSNVVQFIRLLFPPQLITVTIRTIDNEKIYFASWLIQMHHNRVAINRNALQPLKAEILDKYITEQKILKQIHQIHHSKYNFLVNGDEICKLFQDIVLSSFPLTNSRWEFLVQRALFLYKNYGAMWRCYPEPLILNEQIRYLLYIGKIKVNPRKIAHWAIPSLLNTIKSFSFGYSGQILILLSTNRVKKNPLYPDPLYCVVIQYQNGLTEKVQPLSLQEMEINSIIKRPENTLNLKDLQEIRYQVSKKLGYINCVIWSSLPTLTLILRTAIFESHTRHLDPLYGLRKLHSILRRSEKCLMIPAKPWYIYLKNHGFSALIRELSPIFTDLFEF